MRGRVGGWRLRAATRPRSRAIRVRERGDGGMVTAELALALPALVAVVVALAWLLSLAFAQGTIAQAAREGARAAARGEGSGAVRSAVTAVAPDAAVTIRRSAGMVRVTVSRHQSPPLRILRPLAHDLRASATSWVEK